jgi:hypothetical protein
MRLLLAALALIVAGLLPVLVARDAIAVQELDHRDAGAEIGRQFAWPANDLVADPAQGYRVLADAAASAGVNLVRMTTVSSAAGRPGITYYVYLARPDSALLDRFDLASGRWLTPDDMDAGNAGVTTVETVAGNDGNSTVQVVGVPRVWGGGYDLTFAPLSRAYQSLAIAGTYVIDARSGGDAETFLTEIRQYLDGAGVSGALAVAGPVDPGRGDRAAAGNRYTPPLLVAVFVALVTAAAARDGRRIGAMLLLGFPASRIWLLIAGRVLIAAAAAGAAAGLIVLTATPDADAVLAGRLAAPVGAAIGLGGAVTAGLAAVLVRRVRISDLVKGRVS